MKREIKLTKKQAIKLIDMRLARVFDYTDTKERFEIVEDLVLYLAKAHGNLIVDYKEKKK
jgi:hypothetical protein